MCASTLLALSTLLSNEWPKLDVDEAFLTSPTIVKKRVTGQSKIKVIGRTNDIAETIVAISAERRLKHPTATANSIVGCEEMLAGNLIKAPAVSTPY